MEWKKLETQTPKDEVVLFALKETGRWSYVLGHTVKGAPGEYFGQPFKPGMNPPRIYPSPFPNREDATHFLEFDPPLLP